MGSYKFSGVGGGGYIHWGGERGEEEVEGKRVGGGRNSSNQWIAKAGWKAAETPG